LKRLAASSLKPASSILQTAAAEWQLAASSHGWQSLTSSHLQRLFIAP